MSVGDLVLFYHSQEELQVMGIMKVIQAAHQDPTTADPLWVSVTFEPVKSQPPRIAIENQRNPIFATNRLDTPTPLSRYALAKRKV